MTRTDGAIIVISSHVVRGSVGNRVLVFALERLGCTVWEVPTLVLPHHPGYGPGERIVADENAFAKLLETIVGDGRGARVAGIISGYLASAEQARAVAALVRTVKAQRPDAIFLCDPVIGDTGRLYVSEVLAAEIRDRLLPLADIATPNAFECAWLAGLADGSGADLEAVARDLSPPTVLVTSAPALMRGQIGNLLISRDESLLLEHPLVSTPAKGTGDLLAAIFLARRLEGHGEAKAAELAVASVFEVVAATAKAGGDELKLPDFQGSIVGPRATIGVRRIGRSAANIA